jgi:hypothetical protein
MSLFEKYGISEFDVDLDNNLENNIRKIHELFENIRIRVEQNILQLDSEELFNKSKSRFDAKFGTILTYKFAGNDFERIQKLVNELRSLISQSKRLDDKHKYRLIKRLEKIQAELNKNVTDLDRFWGLVADGAVILRKLGEDSKPIVDRIREITDIIWRAQSTAEELPSNAPPVLLEKNEKHTQD